MAALKDHLLVQLLYKVNQHLPQYRRASKMRWLRASTQILLNPHKHVLLIDVDEACSGLAI